MSTEEPQIPWSEVWDALLEQRPLLREVAGASARTLESLEADDLVHSFALEQLPRILARASDLPADQRKAYVRAAFRNYIRSGVRQSRRQQEILRELEQEPSGHKPRHDIADSVSQERFRQALSALPHDHGAAIRLYLGLDDDAHSLREIAVKLGVSRYLARRLVLDAFLAIAASLGLHGALSSNDLRICDLLINHHLTIEQVGVRVGLTPHQVRSAIHRARDLISLQLS